MAIKIVGKDTMANPCVATIGSFDGVHRGHRFVIEQVVGQAHERGLDAVVVTFRNHPLQVLREGVRPKMLTLAEEKVGLLQEVGIDKVALLEFTRDLAQMSAREFMQHVLKEQLKVDVLVMGYDNHFGHGQTNFEDYSEYGKELGIEVIPSPSMPTDGEQIVSSTATRQALLSGDVETANSILGYHYFLEGKVVAGFQNGRKLGYPTANLQVDESKLIPENGAYMVECTMNEERWTMNDGRWTMDNGRWTMWANAMQANRMAHRTSSIIHRTYGMLNIGTRPTLHNGTERSIEVHLFDFEGDLYGQYIKVELLHRLRKEQRFNTLRDLQHQLAQDEIECREWLRN